VLRLELFTDKRETENMQKHVFTHRLSMTDKHQVVNRGRDINRSLRVRHSSCCGLVRYLFQRRCWGFIRAVCLGSKPMRCRGRVWADQCPQTQNYEVSGGSAGNGG